MATYRTPIQRIVVVRDGSVPFGKRIRSSEMAKQAVAAYFTRDGGVPQQESFLVICLDTKNRPLEYVEATRGTLDSSLVHPREVFRHAIRHGSSSVILAHNHPSGETDPSHQDVNCTKRLVEASVILGIPILDHIIFGSADNCRSMADSRDVSFSSTI